MTPTLYIQAERGLELTRLMKEDDLDEENIESDDTPPMYEDHILGGGAVINSESEKDFRESISIHHETDFRERERSQSARSEGVPQNLDSDSVDTTSDFMIIYEYHF